MKKLILLIGLFFVCNFGYTQKIVKDLEDVKNPKNGKLYFSEKENSLSIFGNGIFNIIIDLGVIPDPEPPQLDSLVYIGYWDVPVRQLKSMLFSDGFYLIQTDGDYILPRGKNLLFDPKTKILSKFDTDLIKSKDSDLGGLYPPDNFPTNELLNKGYYKNGSGEYIKGEPAPPDTIIPPKPNPVGLKSIPTYKLPSSINKTNWDDFSTFELPKGFYNIGGYGFSLYGNEQIINGKVGILSKGYTNLSNLEAYPRNQWEGKDGYYFNQLHYLIKIAARNAVRMGKNGEEYGNIDEIANMDNGNTNIPYYGLTIKGAIEIGRSIYYTSCCANSIDDPTYNIILNGSAIMLDEESMTNHSWAGGGSYELYGYLSQGITEAAGSDYKVLWYAQPINRSLVNMYNKGVQNWTVENIESIFTEKQILTNSPGWRNSRFYIDAQGSYAKVPYLSKTDIYAKDELGNIIYENGLRKYRNEDFEIDIYRNKEKILKEPSDLIKYNIEHKDTGQLLFGRQYFDILETGFGVIKPEWSAKGYISNRNGLGRPNPTSWLPETKLFVDGIYKRADGIMTDILMLNQMERGVWDASKVTERYKLYGEHRPRTEPWTNDGNSIDIREVGESQIFYDTFMLFYSGGTLASSWDDGYWLNKLPKQGEKLFGEDDYYGRYSAKLAAVQTSLKELQGVDPKQFTYIHFYYPFMGNKNSEIISSGIYYNGKFYVFFLNPTLENGEKMKVSLKIGGKSLQIELVGHEFYYGSFDAESGLSQKDFKLEYTNIYNKHIKVNGKVNNKIAEHYE